MPPTSWKLMIISFQLVGGISSETTQFALSTQQREQLVGLFEQGMGSWSAARQLSVSVDAVRALDRRWKLHGRLWGVTPEK